MKSKNEHFKFLFVQSSKSTKFLEYQKLFDYSFIPFTPKIVFNKEKK